MEVQTKMSETSDSRQPTNSNATVDHTAEIDRQTLVRANNLHKHYKDDRGLFEWALSREPGKVRAVDGVSFDIKRGETLGVVGESGCGKSTLARTIMGLHEPTEGTVSFGGKSVTKQVKSDRKRFARRAQIVFQDPSSCLDPRLTLREIVREPLDIHQVGAKDHRNKKVEELVERVGLSTDQLDRYPSEFSGGQRQRIGIARALALDPELIVLDEPTSALDVSVQAQILNLLQEIQDEYELTYLFISHDLSVIRYLSDRVMVMYLGKIVEMGPSEAIFDEPAHPYTKILLSSAPSKGTKTDGKQVMNADIPSPRDPPRGCRFHTRCPVVVPPETHGMELEQDEWLAVFDYKLRLRSGRLDADKLTELAEQHDTTSEEPAQMKTLVRETCAIPQSLSDSTAEELLDNSLSALVTGDTDTALEHMEADFESPCEKQYPPDVQVSDGHHSACIRTDNK